MNENNMSHFFSVVIPIYKSEEYLGHTLKNLANQQEDMEVILTDDLAEDNPAYDKLIEKYKDQLDIIYIKNPTGERGIGANRQRGLDAATGQWVTFLDSDDLFLRNSFSKIKKFILENNSDYIVVGQTAEIQKPDYNTNYKDSVSPASLKQFIKKSQAWVHGVFYNIENCIKRHNLQHKNFVICEDLYFNETARLLAIANGYKIQETNFPVYLFGQWPKSYTHANQDSLYLITAQCEANIDIQLEIINQIPEIANERAQDMYSFLFIELLKIYANFNSAKLQTGYILNLEKVRQYVVILCKLFKITPSHLIDTFNKNIQYYNSVKNAYLSITKIEIPEVISFKDFINFLI